MNKKQKKTLQGGPVRLALVAVLAFLLAGCGLFNRNTEFEEVGAARPLEVPPDLDAPDTTRSMRVPDATYSRVAGGPVQRSDAPADVPADVRLEYAGDTATLLVPDTLDSVYRRLGFALERIGMEIVERDDGANAYLVEYVDRQARENRPGVFARWILRRKGPTDHSGVYRVSIEEAGAAASRVRLLTRDGDDAPERVVNDVLGALEERLG